MGRAAAAAVAGAGGGGWSPGHMALLQRASGRQHAVSPGNWKLGRILLGSFSASEMDRMKDIRAGLGRGRPGGSDPECRGKGGPLATTMALNLEAEAHLAHSPQSL